MKVLEVFKLLRNDGWFIDRTKGDHRQLKHPTKKRSNYFAWKNVR